MPSLAVSSPEAMRSSVLFPHPLGPTTVTNSPRPTVRSTPESATVPLGNLMATFEKSSSGAVLTATAGESGGEGHGRSPFRRGDGCEGGGHLRGDGGGGDESPGVDDVTFGEAVATTSARLAPRTASSSARAPGSIAASGSPITSRAPEVTAVQASSIVRWAAITSRAAVSSASLRPSGLNGSRTLSAPAAKRAPASRSSRTAVIPRGCDGSGAPSPAGRGW